MTVLHVDFRDKEHYVLLREIEAQLQIFGLDFHKIKIPSDAIACALDEVRHFSNLDQRKQTLLRLEQHFYEISKEKTNSQAPVKANSP
ncbi:MAG: hypothetical protein NTX25_18825 [Proteobacteria bacterium]|nr:hypothetical protein [Pseudomonadota bacterium]